MFHAHHKQNRDLTQSHVDSLIFDHFYSNHRKFGPEQFSSALVISSNICIVFFFFYFIRVEFEINLFEFYYLLSHQNAKYLLNTSVQSLFAAANISDDDIG